MKRGELGRQHVVHWEQMQWFVRRSITATDIDGGTYAGLYVVEVSDRGIGGHDFMFFEFKHQTSRSNPASGQAKSIRAFVESRLKRYDRFVWVWHDAVGDNQVDIYPSNIVRWRAYRGDDAVEVGRGVGSESLAGYCLEWSRNAGRLIAGDGATKAQVEAAISDLESELGS